MNTMLPSPDIIPVPGPVWLFNILLILTFTGHVIFMNCLLGGSLLGMISIVKGNRNSNHESLAGELFRNLPIVTSLTITLGVAPLLFAQVLYGHFLYTSSILLAWWWMAVILLVITAYYSLYTLKFKWERPELSRKLLSVCVAAALTIVAFIYVNNMTLMLQPDSWAKHYFQNMSTGALNLGDIQVYPRFLHMFLGAIAITGLWIMIISSRNRSQEWSEWGSKYGAKIFFHTTLLNIVVGFLFMLSLPREILLMYMGRSPVDTGLLIISVFAAAGALFWIFRAGKRESKFSLYNGIAHTAILLVLMIVMRDRLRAAFLDPYFSVSQLAEEPQWGVFAFFAIILLTGITVLLWMIITVTRRQ